MLSFIGLLCCIVLFAGYSVLAFICYLVNKKYCYRLNRHICDRLPRLLFACLGLYSNFHLVADYSILKDLPEQFLIISNHQSLFDILAFYVYFGGSRIKFIAKNTLGGHVPLVSVLLKTDGHCMIERKGSPSQNMKALDSFAERILKNNWLALLFPEGTRSKTGDLHAFHPAGFRRLCNKLNVPVVAFAVDGGSKIANLRKIVKNIHDGTYKIAGVKVYPAPYTKQEQIEVLTDARAEIEKKLEQWRAK